MIVFPGMCGYGEVDFGNGFEIDSGVVLSGFQCGAEEPMSLLMGQMRRTLRPLLSIGGKTD